MKIYRQLFFILFFSFLGESVSTVLKLPIPGSILGMIFLFIALETNLLKVEDIKEVGEFLLGNMTILFLPAGVGIMAQFHVIAGKWWQIAFIIIFALVLNIVIVGKIVEFVKVKLEGDYEEGDNA
ncbi:holin-like protein [Pilibacter termitis]|uniref:Holin-like protein n=1 Tax=Pilibacter termitis TaxID=263852 RepID=A0A1T4QJ95_9ENTE|nr:CidA/LrgA family protein [Pilibacter termitis]SKA03726.1 holin-like protein [Pilibacter termitis]